VQSEDNKTSKTKAAEGGKEGSRSRSRNSDSSDTSRSNSESDTEDEESATDGEGDGYVMVIARTGLSIGKIGTCLLRAPQNQGAASLLSPTEPKGDMRLMKL